MGFKGKPVYPPVCLAAMAVTKADRIRQKQATVEPTEAYLEFEKRRQALLKEVEEDRLNNELKEKRRQEESAARPERKNPKGEESKEEPRGRETSQPIHFDRS